MGNQNELISKQKKKVVEEKTFLKSHRKYNSPELGMVPSPWILIALKVSSPSTHLDTILGIHLPSLPSLNYKHYYNQMMSPA